MEVLVVAAMLCLLTAFLFPVVTQARNRATNSLCANHLRQISQAGLIYLADYDQRFPSCYRSPSRQYAFDLPHILQPYVRDWDLFYCPNRRTIHPNCIDHQGRFGIPETCMGYGYNWGSGAGPYGSLARGDGLVSGGPALGHVTGVTLSEVTDTAHCFFLGDTNDHDLLTLWRDVMPGVRQSGDSRHIASAAVNEAGDPYEPPRHGQGNNFAFVDGHVQWLRFPGGKWLDGGPWVVPDMSMYSRTGQWEAQPIP